MLPDPHPFLHRLFQALEGLGISVDHLALDHLCYRVGTVERYAAMKHALAQDGTLLAETIIGGRPIATYRLNAPFVFGTRRIALVELPAPKPQSPYPEGWEHAEFVVPMDLQAFAQHFPQASWDLSDLHKPTNADVRLTFDGFSVKFHRQALDAVIADEKDTERR